METIKFSTNWNNKLNCAAFTTFRIHSPKHKVDEKYIIEVKTLPPFIAKIEAIRKIRLNDVNEFVARIDTGYGVEDFKKIVRTMYKNPPDDTIFDFILLVKDKK